MIETIAAIATPPGRGAIAIVRVSGPDARALAQCVAPEIETILPRHAHYATIVDERGTTIDRGLVLFSQAPHSYTGEDTLELHVHGSPVVAAEVLRALLACGARHAHPGATTRALAGKWLHQAAAVADLIDAETRSAARAALANLAGDLTNDVRIAHNSRPDVVEQLIFPKRFPIPIARASMAYLRA